MKKLRCVILSAIALLMVNGFTSSSALFAQTWTSVENGGINISSAVTMYNPQLQSFNGNLYAVWLESGKVRVKRYDGGTTWTVVDGGGKFWNSAICDNLATAVYNNALYMTWQEVDTEVGGISRIHALKYDGTTFTFVQSHTAGSADDGKHYISLQQTQYAYTPALGVHNGKLYASWAEGTNGTNNYQVHVSEFDGTYWKSVDGGNTESGLNKNYDGLAGKHGPNITIASYGNNLYVAWREYSTVNSQYQFRVKRFDGGSSWTFVDGNAEAGLNYNSTNDPMAPGITSCNGYLYAIWSEATVEDPGYGFINQIRVKKYDGSDWTYADGGTAYGWNKGQILGYIASGNNPFALAYSNQLYVAWDEPETENWQKQIRAVKYDGTIKTYIDGNGANGINQDVSQYAQMPFLSEYNGELYAAWQENTGSGTPYLFRIKKTNLPGVITSVTVPANSTYKASTNLDFTVNFNKIENVAGGTPYIPITLNTGGIVNANYLSGSGTKSLIFRYVVTSGNEDNDGITVGSGIILPEGCTLMDASSISASANLNNIGSTANVLVDAIAPTVSISSTANNQTNTSPIPITITFSENVKDFIAEDIVVTNGTKGSLNGGPVVYTMDITPLAQVTVAVNIAAGAATDAAGNNNNAATQLSRTYDNTAPAILSVNSSVANGVYKNGDLITITTTFSEAITVTGVPTLSLNSGGTALYVSGSGTTILTFNYTVANGNSSADLDYSTTGSLSLSGGTIIDEAKNSAILTLPAVGDINSLGGQKNILIGILPIVTSQPISGILPSAATGNGDITNLGFPNPIAHGVCWNTTGVPTISDSKADNGAATATGAFTGSITGLTANTTYYVRAYATNITGTSYGTTVSFTTKAIYTITASAGENGSINPSGSVNIEEGTSQGFIITANTGYIISDVLVDGLSVGIVSAYTFNSVTENHSITASFELLTDIENTTIEKTDIYPNPASDIVYIKNTTGMVYIYYINGRLAMTQKTGENGSVKINLLTPGMYIVKVNGKSYKLIKE